MWKRSAQIFGGGTLVLIAFSAFFMISMRMKYRPVLTAVRRFNRAVANPQTMKTAGQPGAAASAIQHRGRTSGAEYETPIGPVMTDNGFVVPLPYGTNPDWLKNVLATGNAVIVHEGDTYPVGDPEIIPSSVAFAYIPLGEQRVLRAFAVDEFLQVRRAEPQSTNEQATAPV